MRQARRTSGLIWAQFAQAAGFSVPYLRSVENGNRALTPEVAGAYDRVLKTGGRFVSALHKPTGTDPAAAWDRPQSMRVLTDLLEGGRVDRRRFLTATAALSVSAASWTKVLDSSPPCTGEIPQGPGLLSHISDRLDHLRRLDDELGSGDVLQLARGELALIVKLIGSGRYTSAEPRLYALACEASRQVGWAFFDQGKAGMAARYFDGALRASAEANDPIAGAYAASFAAIQCYSTPGQAEKAIDLLQAARDRVRWHATPRMHAMLAARTARALSVTGAKRECAHQLHLARTALDQGPSDDDPGFLYWVDEGEIEMIAGSAALYLGDPAEALRRFAAALDTYPGDEAYPRSHAIYLARSAEAHLAMRDLDAAVAVGRHAARCLGGVDSARSASELQGLRKKLRPHQSYPAVAEFLQLG
ncbi:helix-turn-helix domain-containing protein [Nocardiopsis terrae]